MGGERGSEWDRGSGRGVASAGAVGEAAKGVAVADAGDRGGVGDRRGATAVSMKARLMRAWGMCRVSRCSRALRVA